MSFIEAVPWSAASTPRTSRSATTMDATAQTRAKYSQTFSVLWSVKIW